MHVCMHVLVYVCMHAYNMLANLCYQHLWMRVYMHTCTRKRAYRQSKRVMAASNARLNPELADLWNLSRCHHLWRLQEPLPTRT